jgi:hypothetical protein
MPNKDLPTLHGRFAELKKQRGHVVHAIPLVDAEVKRFANPRNGDGQISAGCFGDARDAEHLAEARQRQAELVRHRDDLDKQIQATETEIRTAERKGGAA